MINLATSYANTQKKQPLKTVKNISSAYVKEQSAVLENGEVKGFRVNVKFTFDTYK